MSQYKLYVIGGYLKFFWIKDIVDTLLYMTTLLFQIYQKNNKKIAI